MQFSPWEDFLSLCLHDSDLCPWLLRLPNDINRFKESGEGKIMEQLVHRFHRIEGITADTCCLNTNTVSFSVNKDISAGKRQGLRKLLTDLKPWRKGPYELFGEKIPTEWESWMKWDRVLKAVPDLKNKKIIDIGSGNGYHLWRMLGAGASLAVGVDPCGIFLAQYQLFWEHAPKDIRQKTFLLPLMDTEVPPLEYFDIVFSMGVIYHRRSPADHLLALRGMMKDDGLLVLETMVIPGDESTVLVPRERYAKMPNVWYIPSTESLKVLLSRTGFTDIMSYETTPTTSIEQHRTELMDFESLTDFLDPSAPNKTVEGYPAPARAIITAKKKV